MRFVIRLLLVLAALVAVYAIVDRAAPQAMASTTLHLERTLGGLQSRQLTVNGLDIAYLDTGPREGEPLLVLHGFGADKDHFAVVAALLRGTGRIVAIDLPGFGDSSKRDDLQYSIAAQAARLPAILDALDLQRVHLGGSSMGGALALEFARQHPDRVQSLWLLAPAGIGSARESEMSQRYRQTGTSPLIAQKPEQFEQVLQLVFSRHPPLPYSVKHELALAAVRNYPLHAQIFHEMLATMPALEQTSAGLPTPTLIVWGEEDRVLDVSGAALLQRALPNAKLIVMPGIGHLPMLEDPLQSARDYRAFRKSIGTHSAS